MRSFHRFSMLAVLCAAANAQQPAGASSLRETLDAADRALAAASTLRATVVRPAHPFDPAQGDEQTRFAVTTDGETLAMSMTSSYSAPPVYAQPGELSYADVDFAGGNLIVWRPVAWHALSDPRRCLAHSVQRMHEVSPDGQTVRQLDHVQRHRYAPGSEDATYVVGQVHLALGRGFARDLRRVVRVERMAGGRLEAEADGAYGDLEGRWHLVVDPANALVREARFVAAGTAGPMLEVASRGTAETGGLVLARSGEVRFLSNGRTSHWLRATLQEAETAADDALLRNARSRVESPLPAGAEIFDWRGPSLRRRTVGEGRGGR